METVSNKLQYMLLEKIIKDRNNMDPSCTAIVDRTANQVLSNFVLKIPSRNVMKHQNRKDVTDN